MKAGTSKVFVNGKPRKKLPLDKAKAYEVIWPQVCDVFDAVRHVENPTFVYFIGEEGDGMVKVGLAKDPVARLRTMQTGNPRRLRIEHVLVGDRRVEKLIHELWESFAVRSENAKRKAPGSAGTKPGTEWFSSNVRNALFPIVTTAAKAQLEIIEKHVDGAGLDLNDFEQAVRDAHIEHDFVAKGRDHTYLLGSAAGYVTSRPSSL